MLYLFHETLLLQEKSLAIFFPPGYDRIVRILDVCTDVCILLCFAVLGTEVDY